MFDYNTLSQPKQEQSLSRATSDEELTCQAALMQSSPLKYLLTQASSGVQASQLAPPGLLPTLLPMTASGSPNNNTTASTGHSNCHGWHSVLVRCSGGFLSHAVTVFLRQKHFRLSICGFP